MFSVFRNSFAHPTATAHITELPLRPRSRVRPEGPLSCQKILFRHGKGDGWLDDETNEIYPRHLPRVRVSETLPQVAVTR